MKNILVLLITTYSVIAVAQDANVDEHRYLSFGVRASVFQVSELNNSILPANRLMVSVDPIKFLRLEGHFSLYKNDYGQTSGGVLYNLTEKSNLFGGGIFGVIPREKVNFIIGVRISRNNYSRDYVSYSAATGNPYVETDDGKINIFSGVLGGEYCFNKWFSLGAEFSYVRMKDVITPGAPGAIVTSSKKGITETALILRFYPF